MNNNNRNDLIPWPDIYDLFDADITNCDCGLLCEGKAWCCKKGPEDTVYRITLMGHGEDQYQREINADVDIVYTENEPDEDGLLLAGELVCPKEGVCSREVRPFICRTFPHFPEVTLDRRVVGLYVRGGEEVREQCKIEVVTPAWMNQFIAVWNMLIQYDDLFEWTFRESYCELKRRERGVETLSDADDEYFTLVAQGLLDRQFKNGG